MKFWGIKPEIRVVGIDDGPFESRTGGTVLLVGAVFRGGYWLEGVLNARVEKDGFDATQRIIEMINQSRHKGQLRVVMMEGVTVAGFNVVDIQEIFKRTGLPVIVASRKRPDMVKVKKALKNLPEWQRRWAMLRSAGKIYQVKLKNNTKPLYMQVAGISRPDAERVIKLTCTRALIPEPLRVAHLIATGIAR
ncbi:MAG: DUF99 family protein [Hadesarchaea archaeon]|nr:DUF99 family protein [Hadesarchaea archaeon]